MSGFLEHSGFVIVLSPLVGAAVTGLLGRNIQAHYGEKTIGWLASGCVLVSFIFSLAAFYQVSSAHGIAIINHVYTWLQVGHLKSDIAFLFDPLSAVMILIVTGVGFLIHVYSTAYMKSDPGLYRYFSYLNLFVFSMLILVLGENALLMFIGWEGVGLCSYLLIGFWFQENENARAANKAFIVNRVGDFGFIIGLFLLFWLIYEKIGAGMEAGISILSFTSLAQNIYLLEGTVVLGVSAATVISLLLFLGAAGKSAQIPLHVWLPDAMAGPTPVSALIHAATMVTAGVYMIGRLNYLFSLSDAALGIIAATGALTAFLAATIGCVQNDIKKVLAYSTISQLGYMFLAMGVAAYPAGVFHLMTHAFFKACLFLGAGSVILGLHHEQDIRFMGGLRKYMPRTFITFLVATIAIMGLPPFAGFFSKDEILWASFSSEHGHPLLWLTGFATSGITAFYMTRLVLLVFFGHDRSGDKSGREENHGHNYSQRHDVRESPSTITVPLIILALLSAFGGFSGISASLGGSNPFGNFLIPVFGKQGESLHSSIEYILMVASILIICAGAGLAVLMYSVRPELPEVFASRLSVLYGLIRKKYYVDEIYEIIFVNGMKMLARIAAFFDKYFIDLAVNVSGAFLRMQSRFIGWFDLSFIDGTVERIAKATLSAGNNAKKLQTGRVQAYLLMLVLACAAGVLYQVIF